MLTNKYSVIYFYTMVFVFFASSSLFAQLNMDKKSYIIRNHAGDGNESERDEGNDIVFGTNKLERVRILKNGNVGIGTALPIAKLHVKDGFLRVERNNIQVSIDNNIYKTAGWIGTTSNHPLDIGTNNDTRMYISTGGNVGIGTISPIAKLHVNGNYYGEGDIRLHATQGDGESGIAYVKAKDNSGSSNISLQFSTQYAGQTLDVMKLGNNGNVGIGTASPMAKLHVKDGALRVERNNIQVSIDDNSAQTAGWIGTTSNHPLDIGTNSDTRMYISTGGNVGIGTTSPNAPLQFSNTTANRKIVLYDLNNNDFQFYGFGAIDYTLRYNVTGTNADHAFFAGSSSTSANELMRIKGNGNVGIGTTSPTVKLHVKDGSLRVERNNIQVSIDDNSAQTAGWIGTTSNHPLDIGTNNDTRMYISTGGNVGIGTTSPVQKLQVQGNGYFTGTMGVGTAPVSDIAMKVKGSFDVKNSSDSTVFHVSSGKQLVFVGTSAYDQYLATQSVDTSVIQENSFSLWVSKGIVSEDYAIDDVDEWDDYVFDENYALPSLDKIAAFVKTNKHLPNIPSAAEVKANGYSLHDLNRGFLKTIEELTLHTIQQQHEIDTLKEEVNTLKEQIKQQAQLATEMAALKALIADMRK